MSAPTKKMVDVLRSADLENGVLNDVPLGSMYSLERRGLISRAWHRGGSQSTMSGTFPHYFQVQLTDAGIRAAQSLAKHR